MAQEEVAKSSTVTESLDGVNGTVLLHFGQILDLFVVGKPIPSYLQTVKVNIQYKWA